MPGAYAHITLVNELRTPARLDRLPDFPDAAKRAVMRHFKFCELGAVSPDYPYLALLDGGAAGWADRMHYERTGEMIAAGAREVAAMLPGVERDRALAWLLGYAAHVATDMTLHPVVERDPVARLAWRDRGKHPDAPPRHAHHPDLTAA